MARALTYGDKFDPGAVDPRLIEILDAAAAQYSGYGVEASSGFRKGPRQHGQHAATDVRLRDKKTRAALANYQSPDTFKAYEDYAKLVRAQQQKLYPELEKQMRWGGYFSGGKDKYGALDLMHFDLGGSDKLGMAGGGWDTGLTPEQAKIWGLPAGGGAGAAQAPGTADASDYQRAFLDTIAGTESPGYDVMYGGGKFTDYAQHPHQKIPIMSGPNKGDYSSAAGRYQFLGSTWDDLAKRHGYKDFSPANQDAGAWALAGENYGAATGGGSLEEALASGDPGRINAAATKLAKTWTSLPGGIEQAGGYGKSTFYDAYAKNLGTGRPRGPVEAAGGGAGADTPYKPGAPAGAAVATAVPAWKKMLGDMGAAGAEMAAGGMGGGGAPSMIRPTPAAARIDQGEFPTIDPQQVDMQRQQLAAALAKLNGRPA